MAKKTMTVAEYAKHQGITPRSVRRHIHEGMIPAAAVAKQGRPLMIDRSKADKAMAHRISRAEILRGTSEPKKAADQSKATRGAKATGLSYSEARLAKVRNQAELLKLSVDEKSGKLVSAEKVKKAAFDLARMTRDKLLSIPDRISPVLAAEQDQAKIASTLTAEIRQALEELSNEGPFSGPRKEKKA